MNTTFNFGESLSKVLKDKQIRQKDLAEVLGITQVTVSQYLSNKKLPRLEHAIAIADALDINLDILCGRGDKYLKQEEVSDDKQNKTDKTDQNIKKDTFEPTLIDMQNSKFKKQWKKVTKHFNKKKFKKKYRKLIKMMEPVFDLQTKTLYISLGSINNKQQKDMENFVLIFCQYIKKRFGKVSVYIQANMIQSGIKEIPREK